MRSGFHRLAWLAALLAFAVILFGAWVRLSDAGLGCPDWPGCYGRLAWPGSGAEIADANARWPERPVEAGKAAREMLHRYLAGALGVVVLILAGWAWRRRRDAGTPVVPALILAPLIVVQALLGMLTVTWLLKPAVVLAHLLGGVSTLALLLWVALRSDPGVRPVSRAALPGTARYRLRLWTGAALLVLGLQVSLGGWTSANYAALACPDFPTCQNSWWPEMDLREAFIPWRGIGMDYEGGVLEHPARVAVHFTHRLGALLTALMLAWAAWLAWRTGNRRLRLLTGVLTAGLALQIALGIANVRLGLPLWSATAHNGTAAFLVCVLVILMYVVSKPKQTELS